MHQDTPLFFTSSGVAALSHLGVIQITGADAARFIHNQLTQDFLLLQPETARLAVFCNAKGRMQASFIGFKRSSLLDGQAVEDILLVMSLDLLPTTLKRLSMFVMRSKATLVDATAQFSLFGLAGNATHNPAAPWTVGSLGDAQMANLYPAQGISRQLWVGAAGLTPAGDKLTLEQWQLSEVLSGIGTLSLPLFEALVPQMLNFESVGGVNFKKGCYPGQEVVARSQYRGILKRRAYLVQGSAPMQAGQLVFTPTDADQECGVIVQAAPFYAADASRPTSWLALASLQVAAAHEASESASGPLRLQQADGLPLKILPLPYELLADI